MQVLFYPCSHWRKICSNLYDPTWMQNVYQTFSNGPMVILYRLWLAFWLLFECMHGWKQYELGFQIDIFNIKWMPEIIDIIPGNFHENSMQSNFLLKELRQNSIIAGDRGPV